MSGGTITNDLKAPLTLTFHNRMETRKMIVLPRSYVFQSLPIEIPTKQFNEWKSTISYGKVRDLETDSNITVKDKGGTSLPAWKMTIKLHK